MICTKCNNEIPAGAKFCPSCGAAATASEEKKLYCEKCGLELMKGAKFCSVCGGNGVLREDSKPAGTIAAVDLGKPSESDSLVSAMNSANSAAAPVSGVPVPSNNIPMPVNGSSDIAAPSGTSGSFGASDPVIPPYVASVSANADQAPVMPMPAANGEVAAVKKKVSGGKIALFSVLGVLLIAIAVTLIMFFTNRAAFLSTLMGKEKYATMVEGNSIKTVTDKLDIPALSNGIKTASGTMQSFYAAYGAEMLDDLSGQSRVINKLPTSYISSADGPSTAAGFDLESFCKELAALLSDTYGVDSISETLSVNVELGDSLKSMIEDEYYGDIDFNEILAYVNGTSLNYTLTAKDGKAAITAGTQGKIVVNAKLMVDGQNAYIALPFASDKAIMISVPKGDSAGQLKLDAKPLELDEKELERLISECVEIYLDYYKNSAIEMENGELKAGGVTVEGKVITAEFKGKQLSKMFTDIAKHIVTDDYLMTAIADYANSLGADTTKQELVDKALEEIEDSMDANDDNKLVITTVIDRNGNTLGKSFKAIDEDDVLCVIGYAETKDQLGFEFVDPAEDELSVKVTVTKNDDENGTCKIKLYAEDQEFSIVIDYSDCKTAEFCGKKIPTGKLSVGVTLPESLADEFDDKKEFDAVNGARLNMEVTADSASTISYSIGVDVPSYGSITLKNVVTAMDDDSDLKVPTDVIDVTGLLTGKTPDEDVYEQLMTYANEVVEALKKALPESIANEIDIPLAGNNTADDDDIEYLLEDIIDDMQSINNTINKENSADRKPELEDLFSDYMKLYTEVMAKRSKMTADEFNAFENRYNNLFNKCVDLGVYSSGMSISDPNARLQNKMDEVCNEFFGIYFDDKPKTSTAEKAFDEAADAYEALSQYCQQTGSYSLSDCTEAQIKQIETLVDELSRKIEAYKAL